MQINSVSFVNLADTRDSANVSTSSDAQLKAQDSSLAAVGEATETEDSGRQSEQKPPSEPAIQVELTEQELKQIQKLESRDREVRAHEQAHQAVGGQYAGSASYTYQRGPDGVNYAVGGEVPIDTGKIQGNPEATIQKAEVVRRAALAPAEPSAQDRRVAALASQIKLEAQAELADIRAEEQAEQADSSQETSEANQENVDSGSDEQTSQFADAQTNASQSQQASSSEDSDSEENTSSASDVEFIDGALSPDDFVNLLSADLARRNALAVFENINSEPPKINLDELV